jgi:iron uptake system EfeUOB component EfeO/EfeM
MKRTRFPLLVGALMATIFVITGCTADGNGALTNQRLTTGQRAGQALSSDLGSAEPQLEPFDKAVEESKKQFEARLAQEKEPQLEPFDKALEESRKQIEARLAQEEEPQLEPFDRALEASRKQFDLKVAQEKERTESVFSLAK